MELSLTPAAAAPMRFEPQREFESKCMVVVCVVVVAQRDAIW